MPFTATFLHIQQVVGGEQLAEEDLRLRLVSGDVAAQVRRVAPGGGIETILLTPEDFQNGLLFPRLPERTSDLHREAHRRDNLMRRVERLSSDGHHFFLRRADVYRVWPMRLAEPASPQDEEPTKQLPTKRPTGIGRKTWLVVSVVWALWCEGYRWPKHEDLLHKVNERLGHNKWASLPTLKIALAYLRKEGFIDL
jgi:hypothetical protein